MNEKNASPIFIKWTSVSYYIEGIVAKYGAWP